mgnify:CR=1 FL=1
MTTTCTVCELHAESTFKIEGMDCREEVTLLERRFKNLAGLEDFSADVMGQRLHVKYDAARLSTATIADAVADTGMRAWLEHEEPVAGTRAGRARAAALLVSASGAALAAGLVLDAARRRRRVVTRLRLRGVDRRAALLAVGRTRRQSLRARVARHQRPDDDRRRRRDRRCGEWSKPPPSSSCSPWRRRSKRGRSNGRARDQRADGSDAGRRAAARRAPANAASASTPSRPARIIVVRPGEKIPLDGDSRRRTERRQPGAGDRRIAAASTRRRATTCSPARSTGAARSTCRVTRLRRDTTLARIIHLVERAQAQRAPAQAVVERFARVYTPAVIALAAVPSTVSAARRSA